MSNCNTSLTYTCTYGATARAHTLGRAQAYTGRTVPAGPTRAFAHGNYDGPGLAQVARGQPMDTARPGGFV